MPIRFHLDEHISNSIAAGLRRRGVDVTTTAEAQLLGADDTAQLALPRHTIALWLHRMQIFCGYIP